MMENRTTSVTETIIRFFSFFTILTNTLVAIYFTCAAVPEKKQLNILAQPGTLTAITVYIFMVGAVYQVLLRNAWNPEGMQMLVDELLHTVIPILVVIFWYAYESKGSIRYSNIFKWSLYPLTYLMYVMIRGQFSNFYPYPFIDVSKLGLEKALITSGVLLLVFYAVSAVFIFIGHRFHTDKLIVGRYP